jgi:hypothetical protein
LDATLTGFSRLTIAWVLSEKFAPLAALCPGSEPAHAKG